MHLQKALTAHQRPSAADRRDGAIHFAYLAHMAALVTKDAQWCTRIPEDLLLATQSARFRDWCVFTLASNTGDLRLCRNIPIRENEHDARLSLQANCVRQCNSRYPRGQYGPEVPNDDDRTRALIRMLNYGIPRAKDLPIEEIAGAYGRFLQELGQGTDLAHVAARARFLQRVQALPDSN